MSKYINIILLAVFGILTIKYNMGFSLYIPFIYYYSYKNIKNIMLIIPFTLLSAYIFEIYSYWLLIIIFIPILLLEFIFKKMTPITITIASSIVNIITYYLYMITNNIPIQIILNLLSVIITPIIYLFLIYNNYTSKDASKHIKTYIYTDMLLGVILTLGSAYYQVFNISISLILGLYFSMYYSSNKYIIPSTFFSIIISLMLHLAFDIKYTYLIIIISFIYIIPNMFSSIIVLLLSMYIMFIYNDLLPINIYYLLGILIIFFEVIRPFIIQKNNKYDLISNTYETTINQIDIELEGFSLFLDKVVSNIDNNEYNEELGLAINKLSNNICFKCDKKIECFKRNKGKLYYFFKNTILGNTDDFICEHGDEMRRYGHTLKHNLVNKKEYLNDLLHPMLTGISSILKQFKVNHSINNEIEYNNFYNLKEKLQLYGYTISLFNIVKTFKNDFLIEVGIVGIVFSNEKENIENIASLILKIPCDINQKLIKGNKTYILIIPKNTYEVTYGYGSISKIGNNICGDNYLVKNLSYNKIVAIICDGMGKGLNANIISSRTLKLIEEITNANISSETALQILNTLYYIQDYQENYTTVDYAQIDKQTGEIILYKAGAAYTYIIHKDNTIEKIENESLPFGLNEVILSKKIKLQDDDLVLLASDGIFDNVVNIEEFENYIKSLTNLEPQKIAYEILNYTRHTDTISKDDMSIIALKIKMV